MRHRVVHDYFAIDLDILRAAAPAKSPASPRRSGTSLRGCPIRLVPALPEPDPGGHGALFTTGPRWACRRDGTIRGWAVR